MCFFMTTLVHNRHELGVFFKTDALLKTLQNYDLFYNLYIVILYISFIYV